MWMRKYKIISKWLNVIVTVVWDIHTCVYNTSTYSLNWLTWLDLTVLRSYCFKFLDLRKNFHKKIHIFIIFFLFFSKYRKYKEKKKQKKIVLYILILFSYTLPCSAHLSFVSRSSSILPFKWDTEFLPFHIMCTHICIYYIYIYF